MSAMETLSYSTNQPSVDIKKQDDPLFLPETRNTVFPIKYSTLWENYKKQAGCYWQTHEVDLTKDRSQYESMDHNEQYFIEMILAFFASGDLLVNKNLIERFLQEIPAHEVQIAYGFQRMMENIHSEMYALLIDTYISDLKRKEFIFNAIRNIPVIAKMAAWINSMIASDLPYQERLIAFAAFEGIMFSGPFCAIFWLRQKGILRGLTKSNDFISRDEGLHVDFAVEIHKLLKNKAQYSMAKKIIIDAVELSVEFITEALPCNLIGMNASSMIEYIKFVANRLTKQFGYDEIFPEAKQPFAFMDRIALINKSNFFEDKSPDYNKSGVQEDNDEDAYGDL